jgi:hypothetical protein
MTSQSQQTDRTRELGELFVSVTGGDTVTQRQDEGSASKEPAEETDTFDGVEDGLEGAVDADLNAEAT